jgi:hypothetical protein
VNVDIRSQLQQFPQVNFDLGSIASSIFVVTLVLGGIAVFFYIIWAGYNWLTASGDQAKIQAARDRLINAIVGIAIIASALAIYALVDNFFGIGNIADTGGGGGAGATITCQGINTCAGCPTNTQCTCYSNGTCVF